MVASKKEIPKFQKYTIINSESNKKKQTICIIGYFNNILLSVALEKYSKLYSSLFANKTITQINAKIHTTANTSSI